MSREKETRDHKLRRIEQHHLFSFQPSTLNGHSSILVNMRKATNGDPVSSPSSASCSSSPAKVDNEADPSKKTESFDHEDNDGSRSSGSTEKGKKTKTMSDTCQPHSPGRNPSLSPSEKRKSLVQSRPLPELPSPEDDPDPDMIGVVPDEDDPVYSALLSPNKENQGERVFNQMVKREMEKAKGETGRKWKWVRK